MLAGVCKGVMDELAFHPNGWTSRLKPRNFWDKRISWKRMYKDWDGGDRRYRWGVATYLLYWLADGWHLMEFLMMTFLAAGVATLVADEAGRWLGVFILFRVAFAAGFHITYDESVK